MMRIIKPCFNNADHKPESHSQVQDICGFPREGRTAEVAETLDAKHWAPVVVNTLLVNMNKCTMYDSVKKDLIILGNRHLPDTLVIIDSRKSQLGRTQNINNLISHNIIRDTCSQV